ncbi:uncharacterized protein N0V89_001184 [Didymosphaeria variabile]|uniref:Uncharacterized protein n=1 Tax=Didymosphaeria variabile TaxID=1932322 RepID=A0A9W9CFN2_9PLEO|nr:uncharacterized protein N0V89_001184 [Didymosphaeria variabile]KAJ4360618.1 hypothetical protein N0V89_001184 [Didymosphaeria variabile]
MLISKRYSECIHFLYSHNTFAFDDPAWFYAWTRFLIPRRVRLITSIHLTPVFAREWSDTGKGRLFIRKQPDPTDAIHYHQYLESAFTILETKYFLSITPKLRLDFTTRCDLIVGNFVPKFVYELNRLQTATITLAWPEDPATYAPAAVAHTSYWGREATLPSEEDRKFELKEIPWQSPTVLMAFFIPFDVQCVHCADYTIIRRATRACAEVSFLPLSLSTMPPENPTLPDFLMRYWTHHVFCGGWIEFQYHGERKEWSVTQGAQRIPEEDADRHLASKDGLERHYPVLGNPHERLKGITASYVVGGLAPGRWSVTHWHGIGMMIDEPTRGAYYRNVGWTRD